ncbi:MAG: lysine-sensitive aspartokinase 3 [Candidatus Kapabacteria bacterium]|nr:lysine-sensitive aspartokinase 3 [Candidatus Kapabacteria bacterium]
MIVKKFGGTSVKDDIAILRVIDICKNEKSNSVVVVSAFSGVTNSLIELFDAAKANNTARATTIIEELKSRHINTAQKLNCSARTIEFINSTLNRLNLILDALVIIREFTPRSNAVFLATGEILSSYIIADAFSQFGMSIKHIDSRELIFTEEKFIDAEVDLNKTREMTAIQIFEAFNTEKVQFCVCGGFIASTLSGQTSTLGRGGSDYTAALIAQSLKAERLEIWTDVDGILTSDPRKVPNTKLIREISYDEAAELAFYGAKVLHPKTIFPAVEAEIPVFVLNSFKPENTGTKIIAHSSWKNRIKAIAFRENVTVINVTSNRMLGTFGFLANVFDIFKKHQIPIDLVATSEVSISMTVDNGPSLDAAIKELEKFSNVEVFPGKAIISAVGDGIRNESGIAARFFGALTGINISMISFGASEVNLSIIVDAIDTEKAVNMLHKEFFNDTTDNEIFVNLGQK